MYSINSLIGPELMFLSIFSFFQQKSMKLTFKNVRNLLLNIWETSLGLQNYGVMVLNWLGIVANTISCDSRRANY